MGRDDGALEVYSFPENNYFTKPVLISHNLLEESITSFKPGVVQNPGLIFFKTNFHELN